MSKIYLSSTYTDLEEAREAVYRALRRLGHNVIAMEDYVATDKRPVDKCLADVRACDIYVGLFAWRNGYVPPNESSSITELEFREAAKSKKPCLLFLLHEEAAWPRVFMDREAQAVDSLREEMCREYTVSFFHTADELASLVNAAVVNLLKAKESSLGSLRIADIVISRSKSPHPQLDIKLFNPSNTVVFLTEIAAIVIDRIPYTGLVKPSAEYDLLIDTERNILKVSHEIPPNRTERILINLGAAEHNLACHFSLSLEFTYNQGKVLKSPPFSVEFVEESSYNRGDNEPARPPDLKPINVECDLDATRFYTTMLWVWSEIDADIYIDDSMQMTIDHRSGFNHSSKEVQLQSSSTMTIKAQGLERTIRLGEFFLPRTAECKVHIGTESFNDVQITQDEKIKAMGNKTDLPILHDELLTDPRYSARAWAAERLGYIGGEETIELLLKAMREDTEPYVQAIAAYALGCIGEPSVLPELEKAHKAYSRKESYGHMFKAARKSLKSIKKERCDAKIDEA